jgi:hypothetical protein
MNENKKMKRALPPGQYNDERLPVVWTDKDLADLDEIVKQSQGSPESDQKDREQSGKPHPQ